MRTGELNQITETLRISRLGAHDLCPAAIESRFHQINFIICSRTVFGCPEFARGWLKGSPEAISNTVGRILGRVPALRKKWIIDGSTSIIIDAKNPPRIV